jgi:hypothetical protein
MDNLVLLVIQAMVVIQVMVVIQDTVDTQEMLTEDLLNLLATDN